jgi:hypothetical protein
MDNGRTKVTFVGLDVSQRDQCIPIAKELVKKGCQMIELCGAFGPLYAAKIKKVTNHSIPVGIVMYGPEDRGPMLSITKGQTPKNL